MSKDKLTADEIHENGLGPRLQPGDALQPVPYVDFTPGPKFDAWIAEVAKILGVEVALLKEDESWFWCFDDGYKPEKAVAEYRAATSRGRTP